MTSGFVHRARAVRLFGIGLALAGFLPVLLFVGRSFLPEVKEFAAAWQINPELWLAVKGVPVLNGMAAWLAFALLGVVVMALGAIIASRQLAVLEAGKRQREDGLRRVPQYRDNQLEPFIGPGFGTDAGWISPAQDRAMDIPRRRIA
jgi:hypothetical protein